MKPEEIKAIRKALGLRVGEFAQKIGISPGLLEALEQGRRTATPETVNKIYVLKAKQ